MRDMAKVHGNKKKNPNKTKHHTLHVVVYPLPHLQWKYNFTAVILCFSL